MELAPSPSRQLPRSARATWMAGTSGPQRILACASTSRIAERKRLCSRQTCSCAYEIARSERMTGSPRAIYLRWSWLLVSRELWQPSFGYRRTAGGLFGSALSLGHGRPRNGRHDRAPGAHFGTRDACDWRPGPITQENLRPTQWAGSVYRVDRLGCCVDPGG